MLMTKADLYHFKSAQHHLNEKDAVQSIYVRASECPALDQPNGGPVFMSVGQVIQLDIVGETHGRLLLDSADESSAEAVTAPTDAASQSAQESKPADQPKTESAT